MNEFTKYRLAGKLETTVSGKLLYLFLLDIADADGQIIISQRRISESLGISCSAVSRNFRRLYERGCIGIEPRFHGDGGRAANRYIVLD